MKWWVFLPRWVSDVMRRVSDGDGLHRMLLTKEHCFLYSSDTFSKYHTQYCWSCRGFVVSIRFTSELPVLLVMSDPPCIIGYSIVHPWPVREFLVTSACSQLLAWLCREVGELLLISNAFGSVSLWILLKQVSSVGITLMYIAWQLLSKDKFFLWLPVIVFSGAVAEMWDNQCLVISRILGARIR